MYIVVTRTLHPLNYRELQKDREQLVACQRDQEAIQRQKEAEDTSVEGGCMRNTVDHYDYWHAYFFGAELKNKYEEEQELCEASRPQLQKGERNCSRVPQVYSHYTLTV